MSEEEDPVLSVSLREALITRFRPPASPSSPDEPPAAPPSDPEPAAAAQPGRVRRIAGRALTVGAFVLIFAALIMPNVLSRLERPGTYVRLPIEGFLAVALLLVVPGRWKKILAGVLGAGLGLLTVEKATDMGFYEVLARPFDPVLDWVLFDDAQAFLRDSAGQAGAIGAVVAVILLVIAIMTLMTLAALRVAKVAGEHRKVTTRTALAG